MLKQFEEKVCLILLQTPDGMIVKLGLIGPLSLTSCLIGVIVSPAYSCEKNIFVDAKGCPPSAI